MKTILNIIIILSLSNFVQAQDVPITKSQLNTSNHITQVGVCGDTIIAVTTEGDIFKSFDRGESFITLPHIPYMFTTDEYFKNFQVVNDRYFYISIISAGPYYATSILKSSDYGLSWQIIFQQTPLISVGFKMVDTTFGMVMEGVDDQLYYTTGSDTVWTSTPMLNWAGGGFCFAQYNDSTVAFFNNAIFIKTSDKGQTWQTDNGNTFVTTNLNAQFVSKDTLYSVGYDGYLEYSSYFAYSYNGGFDLSSADLRVWQNNNLYDFYNPYIKDLFFLNSRKGYLFGKIEVNKDGNTIYNTNILYTEDFGQTFTPLYTGFTEQIYDAHQLNDSTMVLGCENGVVLIWNMNQPLSYLDVKKDFKNETNLSIYPNPFSQKTVFTLPLAQLPANLTVYNAQGQMVFTDQINTQHYTFYKNNLPQGVYFYKLGKTTGKMVIE
jgi:hypothetical protein